MNEIWKFPVLTKLLEALGAGQPPLYVRLLLLNLLFLSIAVFHRWRGAPKMRPAAANAARMLVFGANLVVLLQEQVVAGVGQLITLVLKAL